MKQDKKEKLLYGISCILSGIKLYKIFGIILGH
jgi:hypothetical protein